MIQRAEDSRLGMAHQGIAMANYPRGHHAMRCDATCGVQRKPCGPTAGICTVCAYDMVWGLLP